MSIILLDYVNYTVLRAEAAIRSKPECHFGASTQLYEDTSTEVAAVMPLVRRHVVFACEQGLAPTTMMHECR